MRTVWILSLLVVGALAALAEPNAGPTQRGIECVDMHMRSPVNADDRRAFVRPYAINIASISCITDTGTVPVQLQECTSTGGTCVTTQASPLTCDATGEALSSFTDTQIAANNYWQIAFGVEVGPPTLIAVTVCYTR
jgi:hypothetical protein